MAGYCDHVERDARQLERLAALENHVRRVRANGNGRVPGVDRGLLEREPLAGRHVDRSTGALGQVGDADEVVPVSVRDENRGATGAHAGELKPDLGGVAARVDDHRLRRAAVGTDGVAVRARGALQQGVYGGRHGCRV